MGPTAAPLCLDAAKEGRMSILNYTTKVSADKTIAEIGRLLVKAKASAILTEYEPDGLPNAVSFRILTEFGLLTFRLPADVQKVYQVTVRDLNIPRRMRTREQAARIAWRIVKDWVEAQLAMIEAGLVDAAQVFLPYTQDPNGHTLYENIRTRRFAGYLPQTSAKEEMGA
jgi:hypothetical protein